MVHYPPVILQSMLASKQVQKMGQERLSNFVNLMLYEFDLKDGFFVRMSGSGERNERKDVQVKHLLKGVISTMKNEQSDLKYVQGVKDLLENLGEVTLMENDSRGQTSKLN
jgi:hypothetical protein